MADRNLEAFIAKLEDPGLDIRVKCTHTAELRDGIEAWSQSSAYPVFLQKLIPTFLKLLDGEPVFTSTSPEQKLRNNVLEILHRLPMTATEPLEPFAVQIVDKLMGLIKIENEDNAMLCMKIVMDLERYQAKVLADRVQPFLDLIREMFESMPQAVKDAFDSPSLSATQGFSATPTNSQYSQSPRPGSPVASAADIGGEQQQTRQLLKGMYSFKVLAECPIIVISLLQAHKSVVRENVKSFVSCIKMILSLQATPQRQAHEEAHAQGKRFTGVAKGIKNRAAFGEFVTAQVKTMSFLAYVLRSSVNHVQDFLLILPDIVVRLLQDCPTEKSAARKELLVAIRHIINFNFRKIFVKKIDELLDESTLIGDGLTVYEQMRPLAYSMLADLIHHVRGSLTPEQIRKTVREYTKNLLDDFPGTSFQTMSAKLLINMADCISEIDDKFEARQHLVMILNAIGDKFFAMNDQYKNAIKFSARYAQQSNDATPEEYLASKERAPDWDDVDIFSASPINITNPRDRATDPVTDNRFLFKNLVNGLKSIFFSLRACNPPELATTIDRDLAPANWQDVSFGYSAEEILVLRKLLREGARAFRYYGVDKPPVDSQQTSPTDPLSNNHIMACGREEKELLEAFASVFNHIDTAAFHEVFHSELENIYTMLFEHGALLHIPQSLLASEATSPSFASMLLQFLMDRLPDVGTADEQKADILLRLFKLSFMAVTLFSQHNEAVLLPHITNLITNSIELSTKAEVPTNYFILLRNLFRSIGGGRFEHLYKEIMPLLEMLLEVLNYLLVSARKPQERELYVELSLTVPARLSCLLPHLSFLMRPLVVALRASPDLVGQGLRTLELCVDNLTADYLDPIMAPVMDELMAALWDHLKPNPYSHFHAHTTMRILGKLGGRNRRFINGPPGLEFKAFSDDICSVDIRLLGTAKDRAFPVSIGIDLALAKLMEVPKTQAAKSSDLHYKRQAFKLISTQTKLLIGADSLPEEFAQLVRLQAKDLCEAKYDVGQDIMATSERDKSIPKRDTEQETLKVLLKACFFAVSIPELRSDASTLLSDMYRHFTILEVGRAVAQARKQHKTWDVNAGEGLLYIDSRVIAEAIAESLSSDSDSIRQTAKEAIVSIYQNTVIVFGSTASVHTLPFFTHLARIFSHACHEEEWFVKAGGTLGIDVLAVKLDFGDDWIVERQADFIRALLFVIKDMPQDLPAQTRIQAQDTLDLIIRRCTKNATIEDLSNNQSKPFQLCGLLVSELSHQNKYVREAAQKALASISEVLGCEVHTLMAPVKDRLLISVYNKPLRALPFPVQIGFIDAITFTLNLGHDLLDFNDLLNRLLLESMALADADDETLAAKPTEYRNAQYIVSLRVSCLRLLSKAMTFPEFAPSSPQNQTRPRIIATFFKALYSKYPEVIKAANAALGALITVMSKLPKDLLQSGLRPILMNLQDHKKLTPEGLDGLARLLTLLTNYFKVGIGARLLEHVQPIADKKTLQRLSFQNLEQSREIKVLAGILNVFHLLPAEASGFLPSLVQIVLDLEKELRRTESSPFRKPLVKYLNRYPAEAWSYFAPLMEDVHKGRFFAQLLAHELSAPLRTTVTQDIEGFVGTFTAPTEAFQKWAAIVNGIHCAHSISQYPEASGWLVTSEKLRKALIEGAKEIEIMSRQNEVESKFRLAAEQAGERSMELFVIYMCKATQDLDFLFEIIGFITSEELKSRASFFKYVYRHIISNTSVDFLRTIILRCVDSFTGRPSSQKLRTSELTKTFAFRYLLNPILAMDVMRHWEKVSESAKGTALVDKGLIDVFNNRLWKPQSSIDTSDEGPPRIDHSRTELIQMTTLLIKYHYNLMVDTRKDVIKFGWVYIKLEDTVVKQAAYVLTAYFIAHYDTPSKITSTVYQALLKAHLPEGRSLVAQALELLAPVLPKRIAFGNSKIPMWATILRRTLLEDVSNVQQLINIFSFLVRHADLFYESREHLSPTIIQSLPRVATLPNPSNENKRLALNLIGLLWQWEKRTATELGSSPTASYSPQLGKRTADGSVITTGSGQPVREFVASPQHRLNLVKYLVQFIASLPERYPIILPRLKTGSPQQIAQAHQSTELVQKSVQLLNDLLSPSCWNDLDIDAMFPKVTEQILASDPRPDEKKEMWTTRVINTLQIVRVLVSMKPPWWIVGRIPQLRKLLEKPLRSEDLEIQHCLHNTEDAERTSFRLKPLVARILQALPEDNPDHDDADGTTPASEFLGLLATIVTETLANNNLVSCINILWTLSRHRPAEVDQHIPAFVKTFSTRLVKDYLAGQVAIQSLAGATSGARTLDPNAATVPDPQEVEIQKEMIIKGIELLATRVGQLGDQRQQYLRVLASLVERSTGSEICLKILQLTSVWVFENPNESVPLLKEKSAVLGKMLSFERRSDSALVKAFLELVIRIYEDPKITRSELTVKMEHAFLIGTRAQDIDMRNHFLAIFDRSLSRTASHRLLYLLTTQNWDTISDSFWLHQIIQLLFGSIDTSAPVRLHPEDFRTLPASISVAAYAEDPRISSVVIDDEFEMLLAAHKRFNAQLGDVRAQDVFEPLGQLQHADIDTAHSIWVALFPLFWSGLSRDDRTELERGLVGLLTKDSQVQQIDKRQNCVKTLLEGITRAKPRLKFPPHVMKFLGKTYNAWYIAAYNLEDSVIQPLVDTPSVRESTLDALVELYASLQEDDLFYGTWRRRAAFVETNAALSYEQQGIWDKAQQMYEAAQIKARTGSIPFSQGEYMLWEDHYLVCAQKLQQWEILTDFAKQENLVDLMLESTWRHFESWNGNENREQLDSFIKSVSDAPTPRRVFFQAFMSLLKLHAKVESRQDFSRICDESIQLSIRKWHQLPKRITNAHVPLLQNFQQLVELHDASVLCDSLAQTNAANLDIKSQELKLLLGTWRERLPNFWDDINAWQDLVTWRQHIFLLINGIYLNLIPQQQATNGGNSYAYRGYHETAWIINRFAHVARKHQLPEVCISQLGRIYTLPNIEIQEAFLKLREQAKCHYQNPAELTSGLDVINNTNLNYFGQQQKAEFYTLKGMFLAKLNQRSEANDAFGMALYFDIKLPKAWAEWGHYNDRLFKEDPSNIELAANAISCYLEAAGQFKNAKSRKLLSRILWLLSLDNAEGQLAKTFEAYKGETPVWYWITFIPQLLASLSRTEARLARILLLKLAKTYPQALYFQLRTTREDMHAIRKTQEAKEAKEAKDKAARARQHASPVVKQGSPDLKPATTNGSTENSSRPGTANGEGENGAANPTTPKQEPADRLPPSGTAQVPPEQISKKPWECCDEIMAVLKTAFPLLALSLETMVDQIQKHFKCPPDEEAYRLIVALLNDALGYVSRQPQMYDPTTKLPTATESNIVRFAESVLPAPIKKPFEAEFVAKKPTTPEYIQKLRKWRDRFAEKLDRRNLCSRLEQHSVYLSEFRYQKFDDVEVPGQYLQHRDKNQDFVRIERFLPDIDLVRGHALCVRRLRIRGHDGSIHPFAIQSPTARHSRREERMLQLFRIFNVTLAKVKETRKRNLQFHLPVMVLLGPSLRMVQDDPSYVTLQGVFEDYCRKNGQDKDDPVLFGIEQIRHLSPVRDEVHHLEWVTGEIVNAMKQKTMQEQISIRYETFKAIQAQFCPNNIALEYFQATFPSYSDLFLFRRQFSYQLAAVTFMTYTMFMNQRYPHKISISRATGNIWSSELVPAMANGKPVFHNPEPVPFRLTPNLHMLMGPIFVEGIFAPSVMAIARALSEPYGQQSSDSSTNAYEMEEQLSIFIRDEMEFWFTQQRRSSVADGQLRESVQGNADRIVKLATALARAPEGKGLPANQTVIDEVAKATDPEKLAQAEGLWMGYL